MGCFSLWGMASSGVRGEGTGGTASVFVKWSMIVEIVGALLGGVYQDGCVLVAGLRVG